MADTVTDPLEKAVLSGAIFAGPDPEGVEPHRPADDSDFDSDDAGPAGFPGGPGGAGGSMPSGPVKTTKGQSHNTGVKGVLADYRNRNNDRSQASGKQTSTVRSGVKSMSINDTKASSGDLSDSSSAGLSDSEQHARDAYRRKRMQEMTLMGSQERRANGSEQPKFGHLREVGQSQFIKAIEDRDALCVIVHVYDPSLVSCIVLNAHLSSLARRYPHTKFLRALSRDLEFAQGDEEDVLPTLLVYRQGDMFKNLVAFDRELSTWEGQDEDDEVESGRISRDSVEAALVRHGVLQKHAAVSADVVPEGSDSD